MKIPILGTGLSGLVGSRVVELLSDQFEFTDLSFTTGVDIANYGEVKEIFEKNPASVVLHMAAKADVDGCEDDKILGEEGAAWMVNVVGTQNVTEVARQTNKKIIYISTDFVFDGTKDFYTEEDTPNPVNWYGYTKYEGERYIKESGVKYCIARLAYPYRSDFPQKTDFLRRILTKAKDGEIIYALTDHIFTPTFIDDLACALAILFRRQVAGIFHLVGSTSLSPYEATKILLRTFGLKAKVEKVERKNYFHDRACRPFKLALKNDKITKLGVKMSGFEQGINKVKNQL